MVKVVVDNNRGLVQETGTGSVEIRDSSGLKVFNPHMNARLHVVTGTGTAADDASSTTITDLVPVGSVVLCGEVAVETASAGGNSVNITSVGVTGDVDPKTGYLIDMKVLADLIKSEVEEYMDHKNLNVQVAEFKTLNPTAEHIAYVIWNRLRVKLNTSFDLKVTLYETPRNFVEYCGE